MGNVFVEDDTIGNALARAMQPPDIAGTYLKGLQARNMLDQRAAFDKYSNANRAFWDTPAQAPSVPYSQMPASPEGIPWEGPPSPATPAEQQANEEVRRVRARELGIATSELGMRHASSAGDVAGAAPKFFGQTQVLSQGLPQTPAGMLTLETQLSGKLPDVLFDPTKTQLTPALAQTRMRTYEDKVARGLPTDDAENRTYRSDLDFVNGIKPKVGESQTSFSRDQLLSPAQQAALARASGPQVGQPAPVTPDAAAPAAAPAAAAAPPPALQPASVAGPGSAVTTQTDAPRAPPKVGDMIGGFRYLGGNPNDKNSYAPVAAPAAAAPAAAAPAGGARTVIGPDGQPITIQQTGDPKASTMELAKQARAVDLVEGVRQQIEKVVGLQRDPQTQTPIGITNKYVPGRMAQSVSSAIGDYPYGQGLAQFIDEQGRAPGESKMDNYAVLTNNWIEQVVRLVSGATVLPAERQAYRSMYMPNANDSDQTIMMKFELMRNWATASNQAATPAEAINMMRQAVGGNPTLKAQIDAMEAKAVQAGTLNKPYDQLRAGQ